MPENRSITDISKEVQEVLKFTCKECNFKTKAKDRMEKHVHSQHENVDTEQITFVCGQCNHAFLEADDYDSHVKSHDKPVPLKAKTGAPVVGEQLMIEMSVRNS